VLFSYMDRVDRGTTSRVPCLKFFRKETLFSKRFVSIIRCDKLVPRYKEGMKVDGERERERGKQIP
jgi:hypothetical protein